MIPLAWASAGPREVPVRWRIEVPRMGVSVTTEALSTKAWMPNTIPY